MPIVQIDNLSFSYEQNSVLTDVNLTIHNLDSICIVGPNGGGKTTLIKCILGLLTPNQGKVTVFGGSPEQAHLRMGYVPQYASFDPFFPISVKDPPFWPLAYLLSVWEGWGDQSVENIQREIKSWQEQPLKKSI